tara:strand:+ start:12 stop:1082 length:1071 start_codon:yes stop_codon:yes gene_type:complete
MYSLIMAGKKKELVDFFIDLLESTDFEKSRLSLPRKPIVIFCGGQSAACRSIKFEEVPNTPFSSIRECLKALHLQYYPNYLFFMPEDIKGWQNGAVFNDLLEFEMAFSHLSSVITIITETPGALAELGVFASDKLNKNKLLVISNDSFADAPSFINKGINEYVRKNNNEAVKFFNIDSFRMNVNGGTAPLTLTQQTARDIYDEVEEFIKEKVKQKSSAFSIKNKTHLFALLIDAFQIFRVISKDELFDLADYVNLHFKDDVLNRSDIRQFLMLMRELEFVKFITAGSKKLFYIADMTALPKLAFIYKKKKTFDRNREMLDIMKFYEADAESNRINRSKLDAIKTIFGPQSDEGSFW